MITQSLCLSSVHLSADVVTGSYTLEHQSSIGVKYESDNGAKITYSDKISNFLGGAWRMAKDSSPYTLYYANRSRSESVPLTGWENIDGVKYHGDILTQPCTGVAPDPSVAVSMTPSVTPSITPTVTPSSTPIPVGLNNTHNALTEVCTVFARATINHVSHLNLKTSTDYTILLTGYSLNYTTSVYISCNNDAYDMQLHDLYDSTEYPPFSGVPVDYTVISENELIVNIPSSEINTTIDIIVANPAGYGKLTPEYEPVSTEWLEHNLQHSTIDITG